MKTDRSCPDCATTFTAVADYCSCPDCGRRFYASDPSRPVQHRLSEEITINATDVGFEESGGILNIWFDDQNQSDLAFQRVSDDHLDEYDDPGCVQCEVNDQLNASADGFDAGGFSDCEIWLQFKDHNVMNGMLRVVARFDVGGRLPELRSAVAQLMRGKPHFTFDPPPTG